MRHIVGRSVFLKTLLLLYMGDETVTASAGTERVLTNMANAMVERGYNVIVATNDKTDAVPYFPFDARVHCLYLNVDTKKIPFSVKVKREINRIFPILDKPVEAYRASVFPLALTEAMATGLPSVGFRSADAVNELIVDGENGILCEDGVSAFVQGLERLMKEPALRSAMGRQAVADMKPYYPEAVWNQWQMLIDEQIQQASRL